MKTIKLFRLTCGLVTLGVICSRVSAGVLFSSDGSDSNIFQNSWYSYDDTELGTGSGCTTATNDPFIVNDVSQTSYLVATSYPIAFLNTPTTASDSGIWLGFLLQPIAPNTWAGGINLFGDTSLPANHHLTQYAGTFGWYNNDMTISIRDPLNNISAGYSIVDGQRVAVMVHLYDTGHSGTFNTGDLYVNTNLADVVTLGTPLASGFTLGGAVASLGAIRLAADPVNPETRNYDNIVVATTMQEMLSFVNTGDAGVPEPSALALTALGGLIGLRRFRRRK